MDNKQVDEHCQVAGGYSVIVNRASDLLLLRKFEDCLDLCQKCIAEAKNFPEKPSAVQAIESLCLLAIQTYAELNRWQEVLTFVTHLYDGIEDCPQKVVQLCILLHSHVQDYTTCNAVAHIWLRNPRNHDKSEYTLIVELFILYVLVPQGKIDDIPAFIEGCSGLKPDTKSVLSHYVNNVERRKLSKSSSEKQLKYPKVHTETKLKTVQSKEGLLNFVCNFAKRICSSLSLINLTFVRNILIIAVILYFIIHRTSYGIPSHLKGLASYFMALYKSLFQLPE